MSVKTDSDWTPEAVTKLWDWISSNPALEETYFSHGAGKGIIEFIRESGRLQGPALDFGCGRGDLVKQLLRADIACAGADFSEESLHQCTETQAQNPLWLGGQVVNLKSGTGFPDEEFALITCVEVVEHLPETYLEKTFSELYRLLRPGGVLLVTTPHKEVLRNNSIYCPFCDSEFHRWQHMRSVSPSDLMGWSEAAGFRALFCDRLDFREMEGSILPWTGWRTASYETIRHWVNWTLLGLFDRLYPKPFPHGHRFNIRLRAGERNTLCLLAEKPK